MKQYWNGTTMVGCQIIIFQFSGLYNKYEKTTILIIMHWSHAGGMRTAEQTGNDNGFR